MFPIILLYIILFEVTGLGSIVQTVRPIWQYHRKVGTGPTSVLIHLFVTLYW